MLLLTAPGYVYALPHRVMFMLYRTGLLLTSLTAPGYYVRLLPHRVYLLSLPHWVYLLALPHQL